VVGRRTMPVLLIGGGVDNVAGADVDDGAASGLGPPGPLGDVEALAEGVRMPCAARPGLKWTMPARAREGSWPL